MKTGLRVVAFGLIGLVGVALGIHLWASLASDRVLSRTLDAHEVDFPVPFPLTPEERESLAPPDAEVEAGLAHARALERGRHLVEARYACAECHGADFGGGVMVDAFPLGRLLGPNLTSGEGGVVGDYRPADWDRVVRHGILPDGRPAVMPSEDFLRMSDQELSDIVAYIASLPPVDRVMEPSSFGPLGKILVATGRIEPSADLIGAHHEPHAALPPPAAPTEEFGRHLAGVCTGCHGMQLAGGTIHGGDPAWGPAANLTLHPDGLEGWSFEDFERAMLQNRRPDGSEIVAPMTLITPFAERMTPVELEALWIYLSALEPRPTGS